MEDTLDDFLQKYKGTFVFIKPGATEYLVQFKGVDDNRDLCFVSPKLGTVHIKFENAYEQICTRFPETGLYNVGDKSFSFFHRLPERQYKRCPHEQNSNIERIGDGAYHPVTYNTIEDCFFPTYPKNKAQAIIFVDIRGGTALNRSFGISISDTHDYDLWYLNNHIGYIKNDKVLVEYEPIRQEVIDYFGKELVWKS